MYIKISTDVCEMNWKEVSKIPSEWKFEENDCVVKEVLKIARKRTNEKNYKT